MRLILNTKYPQIAFEAGVWSRKLVILVTFLGSTPSVLPEAQGVFSGHSLGVVPPHLPLIQRNWGGGQGNILPKARHFLPFLSPIEYLTLPYFFRTGSMQKPTSQPVLSSHPPYS